MDIKSIETELNKVDTILENVIIMSLETVGKNPAHEKAIFSIYENHARKLMDFFILEAEKRGNRQMGKNLIKHFLFRRF